MDQPIVDPRLTTTLGFNAGYVDTAGYLALNGLFTAHVTGNFVTFGAAIVHGTSGALLKLAALPVFCLAVALARVASMRLQRGGRAPIPVLMFAKIVLLLLAAVVAIVAGPVFGRDPPVAFTVGMTLVAAMAIQNAIQRMHMASAPPSTLMTGTTTQIVIDLADLALGASGEARAAALARLRKMAPALLAFAAGCGIAAGAYIAAREWCFILPPMVALLAAFLAAQRPAVPAAA